MGVTRTFASAGEAEAFSAAVAAHAGMPWTGTPVGGGKHAPGITARIVAPVGADVTLPDAAHAATTHIGPTMTAKDPKWFGARGDGANDDTVALQAAIDASAGGSVLLQPGTYKITAPLVLRDHIALVGAHERSTCLAQSDPTKDVIEIQSNTQGVRIESLYLYGGRNGIHQVLGGNWYIDRNSSFRDLRITSQANSGILLEGGQIGCAHRGLSFENCGDYGVYVDGPDLVGSTTWDNMRVAGARQAGVFFKNPTGSGLMVGITMTGLVLEYNRRVGMRLYSTQVTLINPHFEGNGIEDDANYPAGVPDVSLDSNWPDPTATAQCRIIGGVFSTPGAFQAGPPPYDTTACRVWARNYGCILSEMGTFHRNNDRLDGANHADHLVTRLMNVEGFVTVGCASVESRWP